MSTNNDGEKVMASKEQQRLVHDNLDVTMERMPHHHDKTEATLPYLDQLLENPLEFSPLLAAVADNVNHEHSVGAPATSPVVHSGDDMTPTFCNNMMMSMNSHERVQNGMASMSLGGGMGGGMIMYMDGFKFSLAGNQSCLNLYFPSWTLDTRLKFMGALLLVFLISFGTEGVSKMRHTFASRPAFREQQSRRTRQIIISALHGIQALLGYTVMLATMTFSIEILLSVVLGLSCGYYYFFAGEIGLEGHVTTNPCCSYMQDESDEHEQQVQQQQQQLQRQSLQMQQEDSMTTGLLLATSSAGGGEGDRNSLPASGPHNVV